MGSNSEAGRLYRKLSLPARFGSRGSLRKSPKPTNTTSRPPAPDPPELSGKPPPLPPKPPPLLPKTSSMHPHPPKLTPDPPNLTPYPTKLTPYPPTFSPDPPNLTPYPPTLSPDPQNLTPYPPTLTSTPPHLTPEPSDRTPPGLEVPPGFADLTLEPSSRMLISTGHASAILQGLEHFRSDKTLCDVTLESGDGRETIPVHRVIMASASEYFRTTLTGGGAEQGVVKLQGVSGRGLRSIVDFIYTGRLRLGMDSLRDTLGAASHLQVQPVLQLCNQLLSSELTVDNCVEVDSIARELQLEQVQSRVKEFVCVNFSALVRSGRFLQLSEPCIGHALSSDGLRGLTEAELYGVARDWLDRDAVGRGQHTHGLMSLVRFPLMPPAELLRITQADAGLRSRAACAQLLLEASAYQTLPFLQPVLQSPRTRVRSDSAPLLLLGGATHRHLAVSRQLCFYDDEAEVWRALRPLEEERYQHAVALLGGFLFAAGGQGRYDSEGGGATDSAHRYDPRGDRWLQLAPLGEKRTLFQLCALGDRLYATGGRNSSGELGTVESYDFRKNEWKFVSPMAEPLYGHAGAVHQGLMYISGGISRDTCRRDLSCYDPVADAWSRCAPMATARALHCMSEVGGRLYVMGGNRALGGGDYADVLSVEFYSPAAGQWTAAAPMPLGQSDAGVAVWAGRVYVLGGFQWSRRCMVDSAQRYDPESDSWDEAFGLPEPVGGARACALAIPPTDRPLQSHAHEYPLGMPTS